MSGCSIDEAFPDTAAISGSVARREERKKAKMCKGPALSFLKAGGEGNGIDDMKDPDRQHLNALPPPEVMGIRGVGLEGFENSGTQNPSNEMWERKKESPEEQKLKELAKNLIGQRVDDVIGEKSRNTLPTPEGPNKLPDPGKDVFGANIASYFGKAITDTLSSKQSISVAPKVLPGAEAFADYSSSLADTTGYRLTSNQNADFLGSFAASALDKASGKPYLSTPSINNAWKSLTPMGAQSSFFDSLPYPGGTRGEDSFFSKDDKEALLKKIDILFAKLNDLEAKKNDYAHVEVSLFVLSGLFLIYGLDALRRV